MSSYLPQRFLATACLFAAMVCTAKADNFDALYVFGDSLSDAGNLAIATNGVEPAAPYSNGRFSNGNVWVQDMAATLGLPAAAVPSLAGGTDYAVGGAVSGNVNPGDLLTPVTGQLAAYSAKTPVGDPNALYMIWIGSNDLRAILGSGVNANTAQTEALSAVMNIDTAISQLKATGAKNFLIVTVPDLGKTPAALAAGPVGAAAASGLSYFFDQSLVGSLAGVDAGLNLQVLDAYTLIDSITANPSAYGFSDVTDPCLTGAVNYAGGTPCANPNSYLFWDQIHPTAAGQALVADAALQLVPEPAAVTMVLSGFGVLGMVLVRRRGRNLLN